MAVFVIRRLAVSFLILFVSTFLMFVLVANAGDPLADLRTNNSPSRDRLIAARVDRLNLDQPVPQRYLSWLRGVTGCVVPGQPCDLGQNREGQDVTALLSNAMSSTLRLVIIATVLAIIIGISIGIVSALRQYTGFDYTITFSAFLFFSLPIFWVAVLLKQYMAIGLNRWLRDPSVSLTAAVVLSLLSALVWGAIVGGPSRRKWIVRGGAFVASLALLVFLDATEWFLRPALGPGLISLLAIGIAVGVTVLVSGLNRRNVLYAALATAGVGIVSQFFVIPVLESRTWATWGTIFGLLLLGLLVAAVIGFLLGGLDKGQAIRASMITAALVGLTMCVDVLMRAYPDYSRRVRGIVVATTGSNTPNFTGTFWEELLDVGGHLILPTLAIMLISFATYSRYSRASMLETLNQDYVRTARSKGLTERTVVMRHAFRNALIPVTTLMAFDFGAVLGGAVITETVFAWRGMGYLFVRGLGQVDPNPVMAFYIVTAAAIFLFNLIADVLYAYLDPRIRLA